MDGEIRAAGAYGNMKAAVLADGRPALLSPALDFLMSGGGALLVLAALMLLAPAVMVPEDGSRPTGAIPDLMLALAYIVNFPHFAASYQLLYHRFRARLAAIRPHRELWWRTVNAGIVIPILLVLVLAYTGFSAMRGESLWVGISIHLLIFFVGWHYVKQAFGVFIMLSSARRIFYTPLQRKLLLWNAYAIWIYSWVYSAATNGVTRTIEKSFFGASSGFHYQLIEMPEWARLVFVGLATMTTLLAGEAVYKQWRATGIVPSLTALTGYLTMYFMWAFIGAFHPHWAVMVPFFHSLQYLLFVAAYKRGEYHTQVNAGEPSARIRRRLLAFGALAFVLGALGFYILPKGLDLFFATQYPDLLPQKLFLLLFTVFINVHHFFIDNVVWRKENEHVNRYLFGWRQA